MSAVPLRRGEPEVRGHETRERPTYRERRRNLRLVRERRRLPHRRRRTVAVLAVGLGAFTLFAVLAVHVRLAQTAFELQEEQQAVERKQGRNERLEVAAAELEAPGRIRREATGRLGMVLPGVVHFVYVREVQEAAGEHPGEPDPTPPGVQSSPQP